MIHILPRPLLFGNSAGFGGEGWGEKAPPASARRVPWWGGSGFDRNVKRFLNVEFEGGVEMIAGFDAEEMNC